MCAAFLCPQWKGACFGWALWVSSLFQFTDWRVSQLQVSELTIYSQEPAEQGRSSELKDVLKWIVILSNSELSLYFHWAMIGVLMVWLKFLNLGCCWPARIVSKVGNDLPGLLVQLSTYHWCCSLYHVPSYHICTPPGCDLNWSSRPACGSCGHCGSAA